MSNVENHQTIQNLTMDRSKDDIQFLYGRGTVLETITEQKSNGTMRSLVHSRSANGLVDFKAPTLAHKDSVVLAQSRGLRRKHSLSVDDLNLINRSYHDVCAMIERAAGKPLPIHEIYASPKVSTVHILIRPNRMND